MISSFYDRMSIRVMNYDTSLVSGMAKLDDFATNAVVETNSSIDLDSFLKIFCGE